MASHGEVLEDVEFGLSMAACRTESRNGVAASPGADSIRSTTDAGVDDFIKAPQLPVWQRFLPALIFYPIWLRTMVAHVSGSGLHRRVLVSCLGHTCDIVKTADEATAPCEIRGSVTM